MRTSLHIGCTATRRGLTEAQKGAITRLLFDMKVNLGGACEVWLHHGDCVGGDAQICAIARDLGFKLYSHPPTNPKHRAYIPSDIVAEAKPYADRNLSIVHYSSQIIAGPHEPVRQKRGGTWMTLGMAERAKLQTCVVWPDGRMGVGVPGELVVNQQER